VAQRYHLKEGIVIRRTELPNGDVVVTLFSEEGKWRALARKGKLLGGNLGRLSLFHHVSVQHYLKHDEDLSLITQVALSGALSGLTRPDVYPYAHLLAELTDKLTVDVHIGESVYGYLAGGLRGLANHPDPEAVALVISWKLLQQAGLAPRLQRCVHCNAPVADGGGSFDVAAGGMSCGGCGAGIMVSERAAAELQMMVTATVRKALAAGITERDLQWRLLARYLSYHVGPLNSLSGLSRLPKSNQGKEAGLGGQGEA
jgi:DNA repair protein RecO (recombination protein O)